MSEYIEVGQPLQFTDPNTPTRVGEIVKNVRDIYDIPSPRLGMQVFVKSEKKSFVITSLKSKVIGGVDVPEAAVEAFEPVGAKSITWNNETVLSNMNDFVVAGVYDIKGERTRAKDNLPILNTGGGHSFNARLTVLDSSITGTGENDDKCITQVLSFSNRLGQSEAYIRTGKGSSLDSLAWEKWSTLQRNVNVDEVASLNHLVDNGIYSGVFKKGPMKTDYETFVMVVINDYALTGEDKRVSQFKYGLNIYGEPSYESRYSYIPEGYNFPTWTDWEILNKKEIDSMITDAVKDATKAFNSRIDSLIDGAPGTLDTLKEIADWVNTHEDLYETLSSIASTNATNIQNEVTRAKEAEASISKNTLNIDKTGLEIVDNELQFVKCNADNSKIVVDKIPAATEEKAGIMSAEDKKTLNSCIVDIDEIEPVDDGLSISFARNNNELVSLILGHATEKFSGVMSAEDKKALNQCAIKEIDDADAAIESGCYRGVEDNRPYYMIVVNSFIAATRGTSITQYRFINDKVYTRYGLELLTLGLQWGDWTFANKDEVDELISNVQTEIATEITKLKDGDTIVGQAREIHSRNGKNVTDSFLVRTTAGSGTIGDGVATLKSVGGNIVKNLIDNNNLTVWGSAIITMGDVIVVNAITAYSGFRVGHILDVVAGHRYYFSAVIGGATDFYITIQSTSQVEFNRTAHSGLSDYTRMSVIADITETECNIVLRNRVAGEFRVVPNMILIDLTEMFGETIANNLTKEECDKLFSCMDALPQGLSIANPNVFKSTGWNQFNPDMVLEGKAIKTTDDDGNAIAPTIDDGDKTLAIIPCLPCKIGAGENNGYHIHGDGVDKNTKVYLTPLNPMEVEGELYMHELALSEKGTYVPQIKGYMIVEVPTTANLCAHFLWSEDCDKNAYEPYYESVVELPTIPEMSEYGLAGIQSSGTPVYDEIDLERGVYIKKIGAVDLGSLDWIHSSNKTLFKTNLYDAKQATYGLFSNIITTKYYQKKAWSIGGDPMLEKQIMLHSSNSELYMCDSTYTNAESFKAAIQGEILYYELVEPVEYPLPKVDNNYISSDYGVEQFNSVVPCNANNLYYMRSLAGETRNFLDRLYDNTNKTDPKEVADYIANGIEGNKELATNAPNLALRALFIAAGALYNDTNAPIARTAPWGEKVQHLAGHYYLNGLGDITEEQMLAIYNFKGWEALARSRRGLQQADLPRTLLLSINQVQFTEFFNNFTPELLFYNSTKLEVLPFVNSTTNSTHLPFYVNSSGTSMSYFCAYCTNLRYIGSISVGYISNFGTGSAAAFYECRKLEYIYLYRLKSSITLEWSPLLHKDSLLYTIQNAIPTIAITITLHPDAYARLAEDSEIITALEAQPLVTLVSA